MKKGAIFLCLIVTVAFGEGFSIAMEGSFDYRHYWAVDQKGDHSYHTARLTVSPLSFTVFGFSVKPFASTGMEYNRSKSNLERLYVGAGVSSSFLRHITGGLEIHGVKYDFKGGSKRQEEIARIIGEGWAAEGEAFLRIQYPFFSFMKSEVLAYAMDTFTYNFTENLGALNRVEAGIVLKIFKKIGLSIGWRHEDILGNGPDADQIFAGLSF